MPKQFDDTLKITVGTSVMQGRRKTQEDRHVVIKDLLEFMIAHNITVPSEAEHIYKHTMLLGLFDGHMGNKASNYCSKEFPIELAKQLSFIEIKKPGGKSEGSTTETTELHHQDAGSTEYLKKRKIENADAYVSESNVTTPEETDKIKLVEKQDQHKQKSLPSLNYEEIARAFFSAFEEVDRKFLEKFRLCTDGSTALVVLIIGIELFIAWIGDTRGVLGSCRKINFLNQKQIEYQTNSKEKISPETYFLSYYQVEPDNSSNLVPNQSWLSSPLTVDHKPDRPDEKIRILKAGGLLASMLNVARVTRPDIENRRMLHLDLASAPDVALSVSRSFGDKNLKYSTRDLQSSIISAIPELRYLKLDIDQDKIIILACDGVWDVVTEQEAVSLAEEMNLNSVEEKSLSSVVASKLVSLAFKKGSQDNITAIVVTVF